MSTLQREMEFAMRKMEAFDNIKAAAGRALTPQQQLDVSAKLAASPSAFEDWLRTVEGCTAARALADAFLNKAPKEIST